jgi:hypothetical protein
MVVLLLPLGGRLGWGSCGKELTTKDTKVNTKNTKEELI